MSSRMVLLPLQLPVAESPSAEHMFGLLLFPKGKTCISQYPEKPLKSLVKVERQDSKGMEGKSHSGQLKFYFCPKLRNKTNVEQQ